MCGRNGISSCREEMGISTRARTIRGVIISSTDEEDSQDFPLGADCPRRVRRLPPGRAGIPGTGIPEDGPFPGRRGGYPHRLRGPRERGLSDLMDRKRQRHPPVHELREGREFRRHARRRRRDGLVRGLLRCVRSDVSLYLLRRLSGFRRPGHQPEPQRLERVRGRGPEAAGKLRGRSRPAPGREIRRFHGVPGEGAAPFRAPDGVWPPFPQEPGTGRRHRGQGGIDLQHPGRG